MTMAALRRLSCAVVAVATCSSPSIVTAFAPIRPASTGLCTRSDAPRSDLPWPSSFGAPSKATRRSAASVVQSHRGEPSAAADERSAACGGVNAGTNAGAGGLKQSLGALALSALLMGDVAPALAAASTSTTVVAPAVVRSAGLPSSLSVADADADADAAPAPAAAGATDSVPTAAAGKSRRYINLTGFPFPLGPFVERPTVATTIVPGKVYSFEQEQALSGITANVRSVVFRMRDNHLLVYNPVAPTEELDSLDSKGVSHILLGATAYEHKIFVGPFARKFPTAKVWAVPGQWSFPVNLDEKLLGIDPRGSGGGDLTDTAKGSKAYANAADLTDEFEVKLLKPSRRLGFGYAANEAAILHKDTKTLAITDALVNVPGKPPAIYDRANLIEIGDNANENTLGSLILNGAGVVNWRGTAAAEVKALYSDAEATKGGEDATVQRGWERNTLLSLYFGPSPASLIDPHGSFEGLKNKWIVAPVTDSLIYRSSKVKPELTRWVNDVAQWDFTTIAPAHFQAAPGTAAELKAAFDPTLAAPGGVVPSRDQRAPYAPGDVQLLDDIAEQLIKLGVI